MYSKPSWLDLLFPLPNIFGGTRNGVEVFGTSNLVFWNRKSEKYSVLVIVVIYLISNMQYCQTCVKQPLLGSQICGRC